MDGDAIFMAVQTRLQATGRLDRYSLVASNPDMTLHAVIGRQSCNDGMSDREYGLSMDAVLHDPTGYRHWAGCCSLRN